MALATVAARQRFSPYQIRLLAILIAVRRFIFFS